MTYSGTYLLPQVDESPTGRVMGLAKGNRWPDAWTAFDDLHLDDQACEFLLKGLCHMAIQGRNLHEIRTCVQKGLDPDAVLQGKRPNTDCPLMGVVMDVRYWSAHNTVIHCLVELGASARAAQDNGYPILDRALFLEDEEIIGLVLDTGAKLYHPNEPKRTQHISNPRTMALLCQHGLKREDVEQWPWGVDMIHEEEAEAVARWMAQNGYSLDALGSAEHAGLTPLQAAINEFNGAASQRAYIALLIGHGADISRIDRGAVAALGHPLSDDIGAMLAEREARDLGKTTPSARTLLAPRRV